MATRKTLTIRISIQSGIGTISEYEKKGYTVKNIIIIERTGDVLVIFEYPIEIPEIFKGKEKKTSVDKLLYDIQEEIMDFQAREPEELISIEKGLDNLKQVIMQMRLTM